MGNTFEEEQLPYDAHSRGMMNSWRRLPCCSFSDATGSQQVPTLVIIFELPRVIDASVAAVSGYRKEKW